jgi:hypothetical protein
MLMQARNPKLSAALLFAALAMPIALAPAAIAQYEQPYGLPIDRLTPVEQGVGDVGALSTSLRQVNLGLGVPSGFEQVYRAPGRSNMLMRIEGGLMAVFPESVYVPNADGGSLAAIPAGTTFYIGMPQPGLMDYGLTPAPPRVELDPRTELELSQTPRRYDVQTALPPGSRAGELTYEVAAAAPRMTFESERVANVRVHADPRAEFDGPAIVADDAYRAERVRSLLKRAAEARLTASR